MTEQVCPQCHASLDDDLIASTGVAECPFCGAELESANFVAPEASPKETLFDETETATATTTPAKSKIEILQDTAERKLIYIPPGGKSARGLGCFSAIWNGFMIVFTSIIFFAINEDDAPVVFIILFLSLFWAVGLGVAYCWIQMAFGRTYVLLEPSQLSVQRVLFGWRSVKVTHLGPNPSAELVEAYSENDVPVYAVAVEGRNRTAKFATALSEYEKDWLVDTANEFFGIETSSITDQSRTSSPDLSPRAGESEDVAELAPSQLPPELPITVLEESSDQLRLSYAAFPPGAAQKIIGLFCMGFGLFWMVGTGGGSLFNLLNNQQPFDVVFAIFGAIFSLAGLLPVTIGLFAFAGKITVSISHDVLRCRWHIGPIGYSKELETSSITNVDVASNDNSQHFKRRRRRRIKRSRQQQVDVCFVKAEGALIPLTSFHEKHFVQAVAGLVRYQLRLMRFRLQND